MTIYVKRQRDPYRWHPDRWLVIDDAIKDGYPVLSNWATEQEAVDDLNRRLKSDERRESEDPRVVR